MSNKVKPLIAGNWKMNGLQEDLAQISAVAKAASDMQELACEILICPPLTLLNQASAICANTPVITGGQNCHIAEKGAHTGDVGAPMLADSGARYVIVGHSERRADHHETDGLVRAKAQSALSSGLTPIICVGESRAERLDALAITVVEHQLDGSVPELNGDGDQEIVIAQEIVVAYEPVWAIGTGDVAGPEDILRMHTAIRDWLNNKFGVRGEATRILYGGSMKPGNAREILGLGNVNGGLVGGASLKSEDFLAIIAAA